MDQESGNGRDAVSFKESEGGSEGEHRRKFQGDESVVDGERCGKTHAAKRRTGRMVEAVFHGREAVVAEDVGHHEIENEDEDEDE